MSKYNHLSDSDIRAAIQAMEIGLQEKPQGEEADNIRLSIERAQGELYRRSQKKSDPEPTPKRFPQNGASQPNHNGREQVQPTPEPSPRQPESSKPIEDENESVKSDSEVKEKEKRQYAKSSDEGRSTKVVVGHVTTSPEIEIPVVAVKLTSGEEVLTQSEILELLKTRFKQVATSSNMRKGLHVDAKKSNTGTNVYRLFEGHFILTGFYPEIKNIYPGFGRAGQEYKDAAKIIHDWASRKGKAHE